MTTGGQRSSETPDVPPADGDGALERAAAVAGFSPLVPAALGAPEHVEVSTDARVLSMSWTTEDGTVRLDQLRGDVDPIFWKTATDVERVTVGMHDALWLPAAHDVVVVTDSGDGRTLPPRLAAPTLLWVDDDRTLRLEGDLDLAAATAIAESVH